MTTSAPSSLSILDLFSGIGGFSYAAEQLVGGFHTVAFCDTDKACHKVLAKHWPATPIFPDIRELTAADIKPLCPNGLSLITAGFPCQDLSVAGKQAGYNGERSVLFYEIIRLARELRPKFLLLENVRNLLSHQNGETFQETLFQIAKAGYDAEWAVIPASDVGACHRRERIWIVAYANHRNGEPRSLPRPVVHEQVNNQGADGHTGGADEIERDGSTAYTSQLFSDGSKREHARQSGETSLSQSGNSCRQDAAHTNAQRLLGPHVELSTMHGSKPGGKVGMEDGSGTWAQQWPQWRAGNQSLNPDWRSYVSVPVLCRGDDGLSNRVDRLKQLGNSIVPQVAAIPLQRIKDLALSQALSEL
jgi:DNA (cytosine-5)-methyltransferase 1